MEPQFQTRGIYRPNAQRLSISLAPLVAQRSLLFRVKADLATKTHYGQLTPLSDESSLYDSPGLFAFTASAQIMSAALTVASVLSAASVYSQESWKGSHSPFVPLLKPVDTRRHAIAFSPSVQWSDLSDDAHDLESVQEHDLVEVPLRSAPLSRDTKEDSHYAVPMPLSVDLIVPPTMVGSIPEAVQVDEKAGAKLKKKKKATEDASSRISKHSTAFGKVMSRISLQPSKKVERRQTAMATLSHPMPKFNLSALKPIDSRKNVVDYRLPEVKTPGPIRMSFIIGSAQAPAIPTLPRALAPAFALLPSISEPAVVGNPSSSETDMQGLERVRLLRATMMPGTPSWRQRSLTPPPPISPPYARAPIAAAAPLKKGHRRYKSSPAVMNFDFHGWDEESMPPLPPMPVIIPAGMKLAPAPATPGPRAGTVRPQARARSQSVVVHPLGVRRAVAPPFPLPRVRQASF